MYKDAEPYFNHLTTWYLEGSGQGMLLLSNCMS